MNQLTSNSVSQSNWNYNAMQEDLRYVESYWTWILQGPLGMFKWFIYAFFVFPIYKLYFHGPSLGGWGFWANRSYEDICHELSKGTVKSEFWVSSPEAMQQCQQMIYNSFHQFFTLCCFILYTVFFVIVIYSFIKLTVMMASKTSQNLYQLLIETSLNQRNSSSRNSLRNLSSVYSPLKKVSPRNKISPRKSLRRSSSFTKGNQNSPCKISV